MTLDGAGLPISREQLLRNSVTLPNDSEKLDIQVVMENYGFVLNEKELLDIDWYVNGSLTPTQYFQYVRKLMDYTGLVDDIAPKEVKEARRQAQEKRNEQYKKREIKQGEEKKGIVRLSDLVGKREVKKSLFEE